MSLHELWRSRAAHNAIFHHGRGPIAEVDVLVLNRMGNVAATVAPPTYPHQFFTLCAVGSISARLSARGAQAAPWVLRGYDLL
jgi:hypothetical protein